MQKDILLSGISKSFENTTVFHRLDLTIPCPGITALMGESGRGKSTLVSMLTGLLSPDEGTITLPFSSVSIAFQDPLLLPWMNARDNVAIVLKGIPKKEKLRQADEMLKDLGIADAAEKLPAELSGGMQQRVSLARAFLCVGELLILDEPFRGLDEDNKNNVIALIRRESLSRHVLLVTHDEKAAKDLGATIIRLPSHKE